MDVEIEKPHVHHHRRHGPTAGWIDLLLPVAALFISFISIFIAWEHGQAMKELVHQNERLVEANSLPYMQLYSSSGTGFINLQVANSGIGPGEIRSAMVLIDGKPVRDFDELLRVCCGLATRSGVAKSSLRGMMIRPDQTLNYVAAGADNPAAARDINDLFSARKIETRICYCSVFDDCWVRSSLDNHFNLRPRPVKSCPMGPNQYRD